MSMSIAYAIYLNYISLVWTVYSLKTVKSSNALSVFFLDSKVPFFEIIVLPNFLLLVRLLTLVGDTQLHQIRIGITLINIFVMFSSGFLMHLVFAELYGKVVNRKPIMRYIKNLFRDIWQAVSH